MRKAGLIDGEQWNALKHLETHQAKHLTGPDSNLIVDTSISAAMRTGMRISEVQELYCAIFTNSMFAKTAEGAAPVLGTTLDLVGSFMKHSCDPNAFVFFQGNEMRVRTVRPLRAGEKITQSYVNLSGSVFLRQATTEKEYFFKCACENCKNERQELQELATDELDWMQKLEIAQECLLDHANTAIGHHNQHDMHKELADLEAEAAKIIREPIPTGDWPDGMPHLAIVHSVFSRICKDNNDIAGALRYSLKSTLTLRKRVGDVWVHSLFDTVQILTWLAVMFEGNSMVSKDDC